MPKSDGFKNLQPLNTKTKDEQRKITSEGGRKSGQVRREKRLLKDTIQMFFEAAPTPEVIQQCAEAFGFNPKDLQEVITGGLIQKAMCGDAKAFEVLRDTAGQKPIDKKEITGADGEQLIKTVYVTKEEKNKVNEHINSVIDN